MTKLPALNFSSFYEADGDVFAPSPATASPWDDRAQHGGPPSALLAWALCANYPRQDAIVVRASIDFLGQIPRVPLRVRTRILRPGARIELSEAVLTGRDDGREYVIGRFWRIRTADVILPTRTTVEALPAIPDSQRQAYFPGILEDWGYGQSVEWRFVHGNMQEFGPADAWTRVRIPLVAGSELDGLSRALIVADAINGMSMELPLTGFLSIPPALTVTLDRYPSGEWVYLRAHTRLAAHGIGHAEGCLADSSGQLGVAAQPLLIEARLA